MKMKNIVFLSMVFLWICGCSEDEVKTQALELSATSLTLPPQDGSAVIMVTAGSAWNVYPSAAWCNVSPKSGKGSGSFEITLQDYEDIENRETTIEVQYGEEAQKIRLVQIGNRLTLSSEKVAIPSAGGAVNLDIKTFTHWRVVNAEKPDWCTVSPDGGIGDSAIVFMAQPNVAHIERNFSINVEYSGGRVIPVKVEQAAISSNDVPEVPEQTYPSDGATGEPRAFSFRWKASEDGNGDQVKYTVNYSEDGNNWNQMDGTDLLHFYPKVLLKANTKYYWKVVADDLHGGVVTSVVRSFTTGTTEPYVDGEMIAYEENRITKPVIMVFMGDGFIDEDLVKGGAFDRYMDAGIKAMFETEPYKTYRGYFNIYKIAVCSQVRGVNAETAFHMRHTGNLTEMAADTKKAGSYVMTIPGVTKDNFQDVTINLAGFYPEDAPWGSKHHGGSAFGNFGLMPICGMDYVNTAVHETGGHAFVLLGDEYSLNNLTLPSGLVKSFNARGDMMNIDETSDLTQINWKHFVGRAGYEAVGAFPRGFGYGKGVWHCEEKCCMIDNILYFCAACREQIVKRIKKIAGETYSLDEFLSKDYVKSPPK